MEPVIFSFDERRDLFISLDLSESIAFAAEHFLKAAQKAIDAKGFFAAALSGGGTPKAIFKKITETPLKDTIEWSKVHLYWSDERCVLPSDDESNYKMAMQAGFERLPLPASQIFRMEGELDPEEAARRYEILLEKLYSQNGGFDYLMLGIGEDGHTASLFPLTHALHAPGRLAVANYVPEKKCWRLTLTFEAINQSHFIALYAFGAAKAPILHEVLEGAERFDELPAQRVGTTSHPANFFLDEASASMLDIDLS